MSNSDNSANQHLFEDDGLKLGDIGEWGSDKHQKIGYYAGLFSKAMKDSVQHRAYIDLFCGPGKARHRNSGKVVPGSPLMALNIEVPFDKYVFCDHDRENINALKQRVVDFDRETISLFAIDSNRDTQQVINALPRYSAANKGLAFCFVDPFNTKNLKFETIRKLADAIRVDFAVLIPTGMDLNRNEHHYIKESNTTVDEFLGTSSWRQRHRDKKHRGNFGMFVAREFGLQMESLGYQYDPNDLNQFVTIRANGEDAGIILYHLAFFSRSSLGSKFWKASLEGTSEQTSLF